MRTLLPYTRVVREDNDSEEDTFTTVSKFITDWKARGKNTLKAMKLDMQFLDHHSTQYLDLHADLMKIDHSQQSEAALTIFKVLIYILLEIAFLLG